MKQKGNRIGSGSGLNRSMVLQPTYRVVKRPGNQKNRGLAGSSDSLQGAIPKARDAVSRKARVNGQESRKGESRVDLAHCKSALRELEGILFPTAESEKQL